MVKNLFPSLYFFDGLQLKAHELYTLCIHAVSCNMFFTVQNAFDDVF